MYLFYLFRGYYIKKHEQFLMLNFIHTNLS
jgi:hypothetical protein